MLAFCVLSGIVSACVDASSSILIKFDRSEQTCLNGPVDRHFYGITGLAELKIARSSNNPFTVL